ncbi:MAG: tetratricopeptide repeat protein [Deltaproteobacteria bacterium]|nr:tetratricopeptide repeat protein [Deltaproteobacteria bacterium]
MRRNWAALIVLILAMQSSHLNAAKSNTNNKKEAMKKLYYDGVDLYEKQQYQEAAQAFKDLIDLSHHFAYYFNLAECEYARDRLDLALEAFEIYLNKMGDTVTPERRAHAEKVIKEAKASVGYINIEEADTLAVWIDNEHRSDTPLPKPIALLAGQHNVTLNQSDNELYKIDVTVTIGEIVQIQRPIVQSDEKQEQPAEPSPSSLKAEPVSDVPIKSKASLLKLTGITTTGVGVALLVSSMVTGKLAVSRSDELAENCNHQKLCEDDNKNVQAEADKLIKTTNILLVSGALLTVTGVILTITGHKKNKSREKIAVTTDPKISISMLGVSLQGIF